MNQLEQEKKYQLMWFNDQGESCANVITEEQIARLIAFDATARTSFHFISIDADMWKNKQFRERVCDRAMELVRQHQNQVEEI